MAVAHKSSVANNYGTSVTQPDVSNIASPAAGDFALIGLISSTPHSVVTPPSGATAILEGAQDSSGDVGLSLYRKFFGASEPSTYTDFLTFDAGRSGIAFVSVWTGVDASTPLDVAVVTDSAFGTAHDSGAITPVTAGAMLVSIMVTDPNGAYTFAWDGGIDERLDTDAGSAETGYVTIGSKVWGGSGAETLGGDLSSSDNMLEVILALRPSSGGTVFNKAIAGVIGP